MISSGRTKSSPAAGNPESRETMANRWWIYQVERYPLLAHSPVIAAFSLSAVGYSALVRGTNHLPGGNPTLGFRRISQRVVGTAREETQSTGVVATTVATLTLLLPLFGVDLRMLGKRPTGGTSFPLRRKSKCSISFSVSRLPKRQTRDRETGYRESSQSCLVRRSRPEPEIGSFRQKEYDSRDFWRRR
jgi:hypothetical protein